MADAAIRPATLASEEGNAALARSRTEHQKKFIVSPTLIVWIRIRLHGDILRVGAARPD
jgi:hypothetical protein